MDISFNNLNSFNIKPRRQKSGVGSLLFLLLFGLLFIFIGFFAFRSTQIDTKWTRVPGKIVDVSSRISDGSTTHAPVVAYNVDGRTYRVTSSSSSSGYPKIGNTQEVAYNPARPGQSKVVSGAGTTILILLFPVVGVAAVVLAPIFFAKSLKRSRRIDSLMRTGRKVRGIIVDIQSLGDSIYKIIVSAADSSGATRNYSSDKLGGIGGLAMADFRNNPIPIDVYIDPVEPENYYVDVSDIPNLTPQRISELIAQAGSIGQQRSL